VASDVLIGTLRHVWLTLEPLNLPLALADGLALAVWKHVRATRDVDLQIDLLLARSEYPREALRRRVPMAWPGFDRPIAVLTAENPDSPRTPGRSPD